jgi:Mrp family chromosome partitioning ATPase
MSAISRWTGRQKQSPLATLDDNLFRPLATTIVGGCTTPVVAAFVAANPGDGVTTTIVNLARTLEASAGRRVLVVDGNLSNPCVHDCYGLPQSPGLSDVAFGTAHLREAVYVAEDGMLGVLPAGSMNGLQWSKLCSPEGIPSLIAPLRATGFEIILVDLPPILFWPEAVSIAARCGQTFLVVSSAGTTRHAAAKVQARLADAGVSIAGVVLNRA